MGDPTTWETLTKSVDDLTTIIQQIEENLLTHNQDPSAHGQSGEGVYTHRIAAVLDHVDESVENAKILKMARAYKYIVDPGGDGDYTTIEDALAQVTADGWGSVFVKDAIYTPAEDIVVPSNCRFTGESRDGVVIDFNGGDFQLVVKGTIVLGLLGTITVTTDDATVTGAGTNFSTKITAGDYLRIDDSWYKVDTVTNDTSLELDGTFRGDTRAALDYDVITAKVNIQAENFTVQQSIDSQGVLFEAVLNSQFRNIRSIKNTTSGFKSYFCGDCSFQDLFGHFNSLSGMLIDNCQSSYFLGLSALSNDRYGIQVQGVETRSIVVFGSNASHNDWVGLRIIAGNRASYISCSAVGNDGDGIELLGTDYNKLIDCNAEDNGENGFNIVTGSKYNRVTDCDALNNVGTGIILTGGVPSTTKNIVKGCVALGNTVAQITDAGVANDVNHNIVA